MDGITKKKKSQFNRKVPVYSRLRNKNVTKDQILKNKAKGTYTKFNTVNTISKETFLSLT